MFLLFHVYVYAPAPCVFPREHLMEWSLSVRCRWPWRGKVVSEPGHYSTQNDVISILYHYHYGKIR